MRQVGSEVGTTLGRGGAGEWPGEVPEPTAAGRQPGTKGGAPRGARAWRRGSGRCGVSERTRALTYFFHTNTRIKTVGGLPPLPRPLHPLSRYTPSTIHRTPYMGTVFPWASAASARVMAGRQRNSERQYPPTFSQSLSHTDGRRGTQRTGNASVGGELPAANKGPTWKVWHHTAPRGSQGQVRGREEASRGGEICFPETYFLGNVRLK